MNDLDAVRKNEIQNVMTATELDLSDAQDEIFAGEYTEIPLSRITALGIGLEPIAAAVQNVISNGKAGSGYYKVTIPNGTRLAAFKDGTGFLGTALNENGILGQARLNPIAFDPTMLFVAAMLAGIDKKLDSVLEIQREMIDFLAQKQRSELRADLAFLMDIYNNYKFNWNNEKYKTANHSKVLDIRREAGKQIDFYRAQIQKELAKRTPLHSDQDVKKQMDRVLCEFKEYQLALYIYGLAYFLDVILQESYDKMYLDAISKKIDVMALDYKELYSLAYNKIEELSRTSIRSKIFSGLSAVNKATGEAISKIPVIGRSQIDETLIEAGERIDIHEAMRIDATMERLAERQSSCVRPFIESINHINRLYNEPSKLIFSSETLYICQDN